MPPASLMVLSVHCTVSGPRPTAPRAPLRAQPRPQTVHGPSVPWTAGGRRRRHELQLGPCDRPGQGQGTRPRARRNRGSDPFLRPCRGQLFEAQLGDGEGSRPGVRSCTVGHRQTAPRVRSCPVSHRQEIVLPRDSPAIAQNPQRARIPRRADRPRPHPGGGPIPHPARGAQVAQSAPTRLIFGDPGGARIDNGTPPAGGPGPGGALRGAARSRATVRPGELARAPAHPPHPRTPRRPRPLRGAPQPRGLSETSQNTAFLTRGPWPSRG